MIVFSVFLFIHPSFHSTKTHRKHFLLETVNFVLILGYELEEMNDGIVQREDEYIQ
jgi:hypothetical protein